MHRPHRKKVRHFDLPNHAHELTFSTYRRLPLMLGSGVPEIVLASIGRVGKRGLAGILAFVLMPEHLHVLLVPTVRDGVATPISSILSAIKRPSSLRIKRQLAASESALLNDLTVRERPGKTAFRFWQEGGGYDRNLTSGDAVRASIEYIHMNPVRRGLCERPSDWAWSSWRQWHDPATDLPEWMPRVNRGLL
jgi:putative transposase